MLRIITLYFVALSTTLSGQNWLVQNTPNVSPKNNLLRSISASSADNIWAAGYKTAEDGKLFNLILHYDGTEWKEVPVPNPGKDHNDIWGLTAVSENEAWAVGVYNPAGGASQMQIQKWNGSEWNVFPVPALTGGSFLFGMDDVSENDIWAVGTRMNRGDFGPIECLAMHWDGSSWQEIPVPPFGQRRNAFQDVDGISSDDIWAVGHWTDQLGSFLPLAMHWNGNLWTGYKLPGGGELEEVYMISSNDVWAVGGGQFFHFDGSSWQQVSSPGGGSTVIKSRDKIFSIGANVVELENNQWKLRDDLADITAPALTASVVLPNGEIFAAGRKFVSTDTYSNLIIKYEPQPGVTSINDNIILSDFQLMQNYPNPFNPSTTVSFVIAEPTDVSIKIYDVLGKEVAEILNEFMNEGVHSIHFDTSSSIGELSAGVYLYKINAGNFTDSKKMILLK